MSSLLKKGNKLFETTTMETEWGTKLKKECLSYILICYNQSDCSRENLPPQPGRTNFRSLMTVIAPEFVHKRSMVKHKIASELIF